MNIDKILDDYEAAQERLKREREAGLAEEAKRMENEMIRRQGNATHVERHLTEVVLPVFEKTSNALAKRGMVFVVEKGQQPDSKFQEAPKVFVLRLIFRQNDERSAYLQFEGDFESVTLTVREHTSGRDIGEPANPLSKITTEYVDQRLEQFIRAALNLGPTYNHPQR
jgi:hypothetical protein